MADNNDLRQIKILLCIIYFINSINAEEAAVCVVKDVLFITSNAFREMFLLSSRYKILRSVIISIFSVESERNRHLKVNLYIQYIYH